ncbi:hypothetical protein [Streptomyces sp. H27-D2]|uniref:hypothetical protein n=1 Tax=Streptomyces sp. H27-D2 TaxID=3046304 RepID=UPI002DB914AC|nr:hypothetical protein [Streptomyces sp. H27-D2]MEC4016222.1 hypothetical protein [Streptomyces sp. H27-D2]
MSTGVIITLIVAAVVLIAVIVFVRTRASGGPNLRQRFGPEYDRTVARHDGDTKAAEQDLNERVRRHGDLRVLPLPVEAREQYVAQWAGVQEQFVDSPAKAVAEADLLISRLVHDRGYPSEAYGEQVAALSVHHAHHVHGYRQVHDVAGRARDGRAETEELRAAVVSARELFEELVTAKPEDSGRHRQGPGPGTEPQTPRAQGGRSAGRLHAPWGSHHRDSRDSRKGDAR